MQQQIQIANPEEIKKYASQFSSFGTDYIFSRITKSEQLSEFSTHTMRMRGMTIILNLKDTLNFSVNFTPCEMPSGAIYAIHHDSVVSFDNDVKDIDAYFFVISPEFIRDINFEINILSRNQINRTEHTEPLILTNNEIQLIRRYFDLIHFNTTENPDAHYVRPISRSLIAAMIYQMIQFIDSRIEEAPAGNLSRRANYVKEFMNLVHQNFRSQRRVSFYASKLFISPKYLSQIIKENTGRSAAEWIDQYVIIEAKNLLRFSGKNIQQIAYELNFPNQSSFGKYFKSLTGQSPSAFQRS